MKVRVNGPYLVATWRPGGLMETPPLWYTTICICYYILGYVLNSYAPTRLGVNATHLFEDDAAGTVKECKNEEVAIQMKARQISSSTANQRWMALTVTGAEISSCEADMVIASRQNTTQNQLNLEDNGCQYAPWHRCEFKLRSDIFQSETNWSWCYFKCLCVGSCHVLFMTTGLGNQTSICEIIVN